MIMRYKAWACQPLNNIFLLLWYETPPLRSSNLVADTGLVAGEKQTCSLRNEPVECVSAQGLGPRRL